MSTTEQDFDSGIEEKQPVDQVAKQAPEAHPSSYERQRRLREEFNRRIEEQRKLSHDAAMTAFREGCADRERKRKEREETNRRLRGGR